MASGEWRVASGKASKICYRRENLPKTINHHQAEVCITRPSPLFPCNCLLVEGGGFEPPKVEPADLQSAPFDHSGTPPKIKPRILLERSTTVNRNTLIRRIFFCMTTQNAAVVFQASALKKNYQKKPRNKNAHSAIYHYWRCGHIFGAGDRS